MLKALRTHLSLPQGFILGLLVLSLFVAFYPTAHAGDCDITNLADIGQCFAGSIGGIVATLFFFVGQLFAVLMGWMASLFNFAMLITVFRFAEFFGNSEGLRLAWGLLRDIANIVLLFGFIFLGIMTILDVGDFVASKKALPHLILFAILLNFSLFVSEAMVDIANATASSIYEQAGNSDCRNIQSADAEEECANIGMAVHIITGAGISKIWDGSVGEIWRDDAEGVQEASIWFSILMLYIVLIGLFFAASIMLVARAVTLTLLFVTSPLGFAGMAIPPLHDYAEKWWKSLVDNILFAPVLVLLMLVSLKIMEGVRNSILGGRGSDASLVEVFRAENTNGGEVLLLFALMIAFLWLSLDSAKKFGVFGSDKVVDGAKRWIGNTAGGFSVYPFGRLAGAAYNGYDRAARGLRRMPGLRNIAPFVQAVGGSAIDDAIRGTIKAGKDIKIAGTGMESLSEVEARRKKSKEEALSADKKGREEKQKKDNKEALDKALKSGVSDDIKIALADMSSDEIRDVINKDDKKAAQIASVMSASDFNKMQEDLSLMQSTRDKMKAARETKVRNDFNGALTEARAGRRDKLEKFAKDTDVTDLKRLVENGNLNDNDLEDVARAMSVAKFKEFNDKKEINSVTRGRVRKARYKRMDTLIREAADETNPTRARQAREALHKENSEDINLSGFMTDDSASGRERRAKLLRVMSHNQFEAAKKFDLGTDAVNTMEKTRNDPTNPESRYHPSHIRHTLEAIAEKPEEREKIPPEVISHPSVLPHLTLADLFMIQRKERTYTDAQKQAIIKYVKNQINSANLGSTGKPLDKEAREYQKNIQGSSMQNKWDKFIEFYNL